MYRPLLAAVLLAVAFASHGASAAKAATPDDVLADVASHVSHGFADKYLTMPELEAKIAAGEHVSILCGQVSMLGQRALARIGVPSRLAGTFSSQRYEMYDVPSDVVESHAMLEVWDGGRWVLYDLDSNVQPVDAEGGPVTIEQFADMSPRYYRTIATDPLYDPADDEYPLYEQWLFDNHEAWYDRVLDIVTIQVGAYYLYTGSTDSPISDFKGYKWVAAETFATAATAPPATTSPTTPATTRPSPPPASISTPVTTTPTATTVPPPTAATKHRAKTRRKHQRRRCHAKRRGHKKCRHHATRTTCPRGSTRLSWCYWPRSVGRSPR